MIRIALYDANSQEARNLRRVLGDYALAKGVSGLSVHVGNSFDSFIGLMQRMVPGCFDLALVRLSSSNDDILERLSFLLDAVKEASPQTKVILLSNNPEHAYNAYAVGAVFLRVPFDERDFSRTVGNSLLHSVAVRKHPFPVKSGKSVIVLDLNDIMFAEASKRGPIIHLPKDRTVQVQGTLQALFDKLHERKDQFLRAGGSFIVNLDNVRTASDDSVIFSNGEAIILPVRSRKSVIEAVDMWKVRA